VLLAASVDSVRCSGLHVRLRTSWPSMLQIYTSTLTRRERAWGRAQRRRAAVRMRLAIALAVPGAAAVVFAVLRPLAG
jgi:hypothetical protein